MVFIAAGMLGYIELFMNFEERYKFWILYFYIHKFYVGVIPEILRIWLINWIYAW